MLIAKDNQADLKMLKTDLDYADASNANKTALNIKNLINGFHINGVAKQDLINIYNKFTNFGCKLVNSDSSKGLDALQLMIIKLVNTYIDDYLVIGNENDFKALNDMRA